MQCAKGNFDIVAEVLEKASVNLLHFIHLANDSRGDRERNLYEKENAKSANQG